MSSAQPNTGKSTLPRLPFGHERAFRFNDVRLFTDTVATKINGLTGYDALGDSSLFQSAATQLNINGLELISSASSPVTYEVEDSTGLYAILPHRGFATSSVHRHADVFHAFDGIFISPDIKRSGHTSSISMVQTKLDADRLTKTAGAMFGEAASQRTASRLEHPQSLKYKQGHMRFDQVFNGLYRIIDELQLDERLIGGMALDDGFYRTFVMMLNPEECVTEDIYRPDSKPVTLACEYMRAHYPEAISLTQLEQISKSGVRSLQLLFQKELGCTPMKWLRNLRLDMAHQRLESANEGDTVTAIAHDCGFTHLSAFANAYAENFGELPSVTLARATRSSIVRSV